MEEGRKMKVAPDALEKKILPVWEKKIYRFQCQEIIWDLGETWAKLEEKKTRQLKNLFWQYNQECAAQSYLLTYDGEVHERVPGGRCLEVDPAAVDALLRPLDLSDVQLGGAEVLDPEVGAAPEPVDVIRPALPLPRGTRTGVVAGRKKKEKLR